MHRIFEQASDDSERQQLKITMAREFKSHLDVVSEMTFTDKPDPPCYEPIPQNSKI